MIGFILWGMSTGVFAFDLKGDAVDAPKKAEVVQKKRDTRPKRAGEPKNANFSGFKGYSGSKSPFSHFVQGWDKLDDLEKAKVIREFLGSRKESWTDPDGDIPPPQYLALVMNPQDREIARDYLLFQNEKIYRVQMAQMMVSIVNYEMLIEKLENPPESTLEAIRNHERYMHRNDSDEAIQQILTTRISGYKEHLYHLRQNYKTVHKTYQAFDGLVIEIDKMPAEIKHNDPFVPDWMKIEIPKVEK